MIVVVGSRHDGVAATLIEAWPSAVLCSAEDLTQPGWAWSPDGRAGRMWVVDGTAVDDECVTGVFLRRSLVYPEELVSTHPDDRAYLAAEAHAFLVFVLATTRATVVNPVADGALGEETLRPDRWMRAAADTGIPVAPLRLTNRTMVRRPLKTIAVEVVGDRAWGAVPGRTRRGVLSLASRLHLTWATFVFDGRHRLITVTAARPPGAEAVAALGRLLAAPRPP
jgi:hypothetical protein